MSESDQKAFYGVLCTFESFLPFSEQENTLTPFFSLLMENSVGCVGLLKRVLDRAVASSLICGESRITERSIMQSLNSKLLVDQALKEVEIGQAIMKDFLGGVLSELPAFMQQIPSISVPSENVRKGRPRGKPGERNPKRDRIGLLPGLNTFQANVASER